MNHIGKSRWPIEGMLLLVMLFLLTGCGQAKTTAPVQNQYSDYEDARREAAEVAAPAPAPTSAPAALESGTIRGSGPDEYRDDSAAEPGRAEVPEASLAERPATAGEYRESDGMAGGKGEEEESLTLMLTPPETDASDKLGEGEETSDELRRPQGRPAPLKAGERDDNELFPEYLEYLQSYSGEPARIADVTNPMIIKVMNNNQTPLLDATVKILDEQQAVVFVGKTYAGGETIFFPNIAFPQTVGANTRNLQLVASYGNETVEKAVVTGERNVDVVFPKAQPSEEIRLDVLFLLDTTGSMGDELSRIQESIVSIAQRIDQMEPRPTLRLGLVAYRDRGDDYVTRSYDFSPDVPAFHQLLNSFSADGGGDEPESLNEGLHEAIQQVQWSDHAVRLIFLVADAGPHLEYENDYDYLAEIREAVTRGIKIYPIAASNTNEFAEYVFRQLAQQTMARFVFLTYQEEKNEGPSGEHTTLESGDQPYTVQQLDELIVNIVRRELAAVRGQ